MKLSNAKIIAWGLVLLLIYPFVMVILPEMLFGLFLSIEGLYKNCEEIFRASKPLMCLKYAQEQYININYLHEIKIGLLASITLIITFLLNKKMEQRQIISSILIAGIGFVGLGIFYSTYFDIAIRVPYDAIPSILAAILGGAAAKYIFEPNKSFNTDGANNAPPG